MRTKALRALPLLVCIIMMGLAVHAEAKVQDYVQLAPLPLTESTTTPGTTNAAAYVTGIIKLAIGLVGVITVIRLILAGFTYITAESFTKKYDAKGQITNAIIGLMLALGAYTILSTINPRLVELTLNIQEITPSKLTDGACVGTVVGTGDNAKCVPVSGTGPDGTVFSCDDVTPPTCDYSTSGNSGSWGKLPYGIDLPSSWMKKSCELFDSTTGASSTPGFPCQVSNMTFFQGITALMSTMPAGSWHITEAWPPEYKHHVDTCHQPGGAAGDCIDAALVNTNSTPAQIKQFLDAINDRVKAGQFKDFQYEIGCPKPPPDKDPKVCVDPTALARYNAIKAAIGDYKIVININATGEHVHINYK